MLSPLNPPITDWRGLRVWVIGGSSGIGRATAAALHARGAHVTVSARDGAALNVFVQEHPGAAMAPMDTTDLAEVEAVWSDFVSTGTPELVLCCAGYYKDASAADFNPGEMLKHQSVNYVGALNVLSVVLPAFTRIGRGHVSLVASVAGYAGLPKSLAYGPTKAALINLAQALYLELHARGIGVSVVNPGFVESPLTAQNSFRMPALITPEEAARHMLAGWARGSFEIHYPKRFTLFMKLLALLPFRVYQWIVRKGTGT